MAVQTVEGLEERLPNVHLFPDGYEKGKQKVGEVAVIPMELVQLPNDDASRDEVKKTIETSLVENPKSFAGWKIANLYDFFMLFVVMAGGASALLFIACRRLLKMMHGVR